MIETKIGNGVFSFKPLDDYKKTTDIECDDADAYVDADVDYQSILEDFDVDAVERSPIKYADAVQSVADELLQSLDQFEVAQSETIGKFSQMSLKLNARYVNNPNLDAAENKLLAERQNFLAQQLDLGAAVVKARLLSLKQYADDLSARIDRINLSPDFINELAALESERRPSFAFLVENAVRIVNGAQRRVNFFIEHQDFVTKLVGWWDGWSEDYRAFKTNKRSQLIAACSNDNIDEDVYSAWYADWQRKRFAIEQRFLPLIEFALKGNLLSNAERVLSSLQKYKAEVDQFYLTERKNIYQKFAFQAGGELQEKFEVESNLYKLTEKFQRGLQTTIFACERTEERMFLLRWAEPLLNISIDELLTFVQDRKLDMISKSVLEQFAELRRKNFAEYLSDSRAYSEAIQKRETEYNALVFRMRRDLMKR